MPEITRVRAPAPPPGTPWPWTEDRHEGPIAVVERLVIDHDASIARAREAGSRLVLPEHLVHQVIEVPTLQHRYDGPLSGMIAGFQVPRKLNGDQLEQELWEAGVAVLVAVREPKPHKPVLELGAPAAFDVDAAEKVVRAHKPDGGHQPISGGMGYVDPQTIHNPSTGGIAPAAWGDQVRDDLEFLVAPPLAVVSHSTTQSLATATWTTLSADTELSDSDSMHSTVTNNSRLTTQTGGQYDVVHTAEFAANATGVRATRIIINGSATIETSRIINAGGGQPHLVTADSVQIRGAGEYIETQAWQNSGGNLNCQLRRFSAAFLSR